MAGDKVTVNLGLTGLVSIDVAAGSGRRPWTTAAWLQRTAARCCSPPRARRPCSPPAVNQTGTVRANSIASRNGEVWIEASGGDTSWPAPPRPPAAAPGRPAGASSPPARTSPRQRSVTDASGAAGGGQVLVGGGWQGKDATIATAGSVTQQAGAAIKVDATANGAGGTAVLWSADATHMDGTISARAPGSGAGGKVETSSKGVLGLGGRVDVAADSGKGGNWLLDPANLDVTTTGSALVGNTNGTNNTVSNTDPDGPQRRRHDGHPAGRQPHHVNADISKTAGAASTLTFNSASGSIVVNKPGLVDRRRAPHQHGRRRQPERRQRLPQQRARHQRRHDQLLQAGHPRQHHP